MQIPRIDNWSSPGARRHTLRRKGNDSLSFVLLLVLTGWQISKFVPRTHVRIGTATAVLTACSVVATSSVQVVPRVVTAAKEFRRARCERYIGKATLQWKLASNRLCWGKSVFAYFQLVSRLTVVSILVTTSRFGCSSTVGHGCISIRLLASYVRERRCRCRPRCPATRIMAIEKNVC